MHKTNTLKGASLLLKQLVFLLFWVLVWAFFAWRIDIPFLLPTPIAVAESLASLFLGDALFPAVLHSLKSLIVGFGIGTVIGILTAIPSVFTKEISALLSPLYTIVRATPVASFIIIAWVFLDRDILPSFISALMTAPIVWSNLSRGIDALDRSLLEVTRVYRFPLLKRVGVFWLPSLLPFLSSGLSTALGLAWKSSIATEILVRSDETIGYYIWDAKAWNIDTAALFAWTIVALLISLVFDLVLGYLLGLVSKRKTKRREEKTNA
jgi:NitT/TauT family transport system permease protein